VARLLRSVWTIPLALVLSVVAADGQTSAPAQPPDSSSASSPPAATTPAPSEPSAPPAKPAEPAAPPSVTILGSQEVRGILGNEVRSAADEDMGRIVDVLVDSHGVTRAAIIDFGGFLGVGSRKIAVDWKALHFVPDAKNKRYRIVLELTREQVKPAPEYKDGQPTVVLGASGSLEPIP